LRCGLLICRPRGGLCKHPKRSKSNLPPFYYKQDLEIDKGLKEPSLGTTLNSISKSDKSAAVGAIINADQLAGDWTGSSGAGGELSNF
jgi:hypothetical protein